MDSIRDMRMDILQKLYSREGEVTPMDTGSIVGRAIIHNEDEKYITPSSFNILGMQDDEVVFFASGERLDEAGFESLMGQARKEFEGLIVKRKKLRSTTMTVLMVYDSADPDVVEKVKVHNCRINHKMGFGGWAVHRVALVLTDDRNVFADKRISKNILYRLGKIAELEP